MTADACNTQPAAFMQLDCLICSPQCPRMNIIEFIDQKSSQSKKRRDLKRAKGDKSFL